MEINKLKQQFLSEIKKIDEQFAELQNNFFELDEKLKILKSKRKRIIDNYEKKLGDK